MLIPSSSKVELILDVTESRTSRNLKVKLVLLELALAKVKDRDIIQSLLELDQVGSLSLLLHHPSCLYLDFIMSFNLKQMPS